MTVEKLLANIKWIEDFKLSNRNVQESRHKFMNRMSVLREIALENTRELLKYVEDKL